MYKYIYTYVNIIVDIIGLAIFNTETRVLKLRFENRIIISDTQNNVFFFKTIYKHTPIYL